MKTMNLTEFAQSHNVEMQVISKHLKAHADEYQGLIKDKGKSKELTDGAIEILEKYYPIPKPTIVIEGIPKEEHFKEVNEKLEEIDNLRKVIITLKDQLTDYQLKLKDAETEQLRIEEKGKNTKYHHSQTRGQYKRAGKICRGTQKAICRTRAKAL